MKSKCSTCTDVFRHNIRLHRRLSIIQLGSVLLRDHILYCVPFCIYYTALKLFFCGVAITGNAGIQWASLPLDQVDSRKLFIHSICTLKSKYVVARRDFMKTLVKLLLSHFHSATGRTKVPCHLNILHLFHQARLIESRILLSKLNNQKPRQEDTHRFQRERIFIRCALPAGKPDK